MKFSRSLKTLVLLLTMLVLLSPVMNMAVPINSSPSVDIQTSSVAEINQDTENWDQHVVDLYPTEKKILMFDTFYHRQGAIDLLPDSSINQVYDLIPAIAVDAIDVSKYDLTGLQSITPDMKYATSSTTDDFYRLSRDVKNGFTLNQTSSMIGIDHLKSEYSLSGDGIKIAVLDTGVNNSLTAFDDRITTTVVSDLSDRGSLDEDGHGTHVTGILTSNGIYNIGGELVQTDSPGMAPSAEIISIRVLNEQGFGDNSWVIEGLEEAIQHDVDIISLSLSTVIYEGPNDPMQALVNEAVERGIIIVAAAGNRGPIGSAIGIPGALDKVIAVGASFPQSELDQELWTFSSIGPTIDGPSPDVIAPGARIISVNSADGRIAQLSGTSMATPHVSGGIALLKEAFPNATYEHIREALLASGQIQFNTAGLVDQVEGQGRGQVRFDVAYDILNETLLTRPDSHLQMPIIPNIVQDRNYIYNHRLIGETKSLPFYIHSSRNITVRPVINESRTDGVTFEFNTTYDLKMGKNRIDIGLKVVNDTIRFATGQMYFIEAGTNQTLTNSYIFYDTETRYTESRILFDVSHDGDTPSAYYGNHGPLGQFSQLSKSLGEQGQIIHSTNNQTITSEMLENYDLLIIANPDNKYSEAEISAIREFVEEDGKSIFMMINGGFLSSEGHPTYPQFNREDLAAILQNSGIEIPEDDSNPFSLYTCEYEDTTYEDRTSVCIEPATFTTSQSIFQPGKNFPHFGPELSIGEGSATVTELAKLDGNLVAASAEFESEGRIIVFSSQLPFDNNGILYDYIGPHTAVGNEEILHNAVDWLIEPNQAYVDVYVNGKQGKYHEVNMYEPFQIDITPHDKSGNIVDLGNSVNISLKEYIPGEGFVFSQLPFSKNGDSYSIAFNGIGINVEFTFFYPLNTSDSIISDSRFTIWIQLRNYENQSQYRALAITFLLVIVTSWVVWLMNEGGRKLWMQKKNEQF